MKLRDEWKTEAKKISNITRNSNENQQAIEAWGQYKYYRNKINNKKKYEEQNYKAEKFNETFYSSEQTWKLAKHLWTGKPLEVHHNWK